MMLRFIISVVLLVLLGCASIKHYSTLTTPTGRTLRAGVGQSVFRIERSQDLPNIYGRADLWGEKLGTGYQELRYLGLADERTAVFAFREVEIRSNETTMSRRGLGFAPLSVRRDVAEPVSVEFRHNFAEKPDLEHSGVRVQILEASPTGLTYRLSKPD